MGYVEDTDIADVQDVAVVDVPTEKEEAALTVKYGHLLGLNDA